MANPICTSCSHRPEMELISTERLMDHNARSRPFGRMASSSLRGAKHPIAAAAVGALWGAAKVADLVAQTATYECPSCGKKKEKIVTR